MDSEFSVTPELLINKKGGNVPLKRVANRFLGQLVTEMCSRSISFYDKRSHIEPWHPLSYSERLMYATLAASAAAISPVVLSEIPAPRHAKWGSRTARKGKAGRLDLWIQLDSGCEVILELKRRTIGLRRLNNGAIVSNRVKKGWAEVSCQAESLKRHTKGWCSKTIRIGLMVAYGYLRGKSESVSDVDALTYQRQIKDIAGLLTPEPAWEAYWIPPSRMRLIHDCDEKYEINPVVAFFAYIDSHQDI
jgi:hypothetical protein